MLTSRQHEIITGSLLGDGCIFNCFLENANCKYQLIQSKLDNEKCDKRGYFSWLAGELCELGCSLKSRTSKCKLPQNTELTTHDFYIFYTLSKNFWNDVESKWYVARTDHPRFRRRKIVPQDI